MKLVEQLRKRLKALLLRFGMYGTVWKLRGWLRGLAPRTLWRNARWRRANPQAPAVPRPRLIYDVINTYDIETFVASGAHAAAKIERALVSSGRPIEGFASILDFGCGCGRIIRQWHGRTHAQLHGCDYNEELVAWCQAKLDFASFTTNRLYPPLDYADASFDLIYANSVFTHLDEELQDSWLNELLRVSRRDGVVLLTTHGDAWAEGLNEEEGRRYREGEIIVRSAASSGSNLCETYHPPAYFRRVAEALFRVVHHHPQGDGATREQDIWVLER